MIITQAGVTIRVPVSKIRKTGRAAQGVKLINLREDDSIASVARVEIEYVEEIEPDDSEISSDEDLPSDDESTDSEQE
jgi:DNA gyrase subunit A